MEWAVITLIIFIGTFFIPYKLAESRNHPYSKEIAGISVIIAIIAIFNVYLAGMGWLVIMIWAFLPKGIPITAVPIEDSTGLTKTCPDCAETIKAEAIKCRFCGRAFIIAVLLILPMTARAQSTNPQTVQDLYGNCKAATGSSLWTFCIGYISGVSEVAMDNGEAAQQLIKSGDAHTLLSHMGACVGSGGVTIGAEVQVFTNWAEKHPEEWGESMEIGVLMAVRETWPCTP